MFLKVKAFTLTELIITLAITSFIVSIVFPDYMNMISDHNLIAKSNRLVAAISLTRIEAITRGRRVTLCQSSDMQSCTKRSASWHDGWLIYVDINEDNIINSDEPIIRVQQATESVNISFGTRTRIAYHPNGYAVGGSNGSFLFCDHRGELGKKGLIISTSGRVRLAEGIDLVSKPCPAVLS